ncbi:MAG: tetratricopeptide repeat protein [Candidatus Micrarchaeota archaeon]
MVKRHNILLAGSIALTLGAGAYLGLGSYKDHKRHVAHEQNVATMVERFKGCPDRFISYHECFSNEDRNRLKTEAESARGEGRFEEAALKFNMIGMDNDASEMAGRCPDSVRRRLMERFSIRRDAVARAFRLDREGKFGVVPMNAPARIPSPPPSQSAPLAPGSSSAVVPDGGAAVAPSGSIPAPSADATATVPSAPGSAVAAPADASVQFYTTRTNPFELDSALQGIASAINSGDARAKANALFDRLHRGGSSGVVVMDMAGRAPRTAAEALASGGDCTDLANIVIALFRELRIPGGAYVLHFNSAPENVDHMVPYVQIGRRRIIVDLQTSRLGDTAQGEYTELHRLSLDQASFMYHREQGDYYRDRGQSAEALAAYRRAAELFNRDGYTYQNIGILLERRGDMRGAAQVFRRAAELDSRYRSDRTRGTYNHELQAAQEAFGRQDWQGCVTHFRNALASGEALSQADRQTLERNAAACQANTAASGARK